MIGGIEETSASFEARSAPRSYPTDSEVKFALAALPTSEFGTFRTSSDVRSSVAIGRKADVARKIDFGSD